MLRYRFAVAASTLWVMIIRYKTANFFLKILKKIKLKAYIYIKN